MARVLVVVCLWFGVVVAPASAETITPAPEAVTADWVQVSAGYYHGCGIRTSGRLYCWGEDGSGQLGFSGSNVDRATPVQVDGGFTDWTSVDAGGIHTCARRSSGRLYCWGDDTYGQVGNAAGNISEPTPVRVAGGFTDWTSYSAGGQHTCARRSTGQLLCWGADGLGQLGNGSPPADQPTPVPVAGPAATSWASVSAGAHHTCARRSSGRLYCWGYDNAGQLGNGGTFVDRHAPFPVAGTSTAWTSVSAGDDHTCARRSSGQLFCWGGDSAGQLGNGGDNFVRQAPVLVFGGVTSWTSVNASSYHTCARRSSGRLYCWGVDSEGALGNGLPYANRNVPVQVAGAVTTWTAVSGGAGHTCARRSSGRLYCWGADSNEELGDGAGNTKRPAPVPVG